MRHACPIVAGAQELIFLLLCFFLFRLSRPPAEAGVQPRLLGGLRGVREGARFDGQCRGAGRSAVQGRLRHHRPALPPFQTRFARIGIR